MKIVPRLAVCARIATALAIASSAIFVSPRLVKAAPVSATKETFAGGYGGPGDFVDTLIDLVTTDSVLTGKVRQPYDRTDQPLISNVERTPSSLRFDAENIHFDLRKTSHGYSGTVREASGATRHGEFILRPGQPPVEVVANYQGTYALSRGRTLTVAQNNETSALYFLELPSGQTGFLFNITNTEFIGGPCMFCAGPEHIHLSFPTANAPATEVRVTLGGRTETAKKLTSYTEQEVTFKSRDGTVLSGSLFIPSGPRLHPAVVFAHGSNAQTRNGYYGHIRFLAEAYARRGIAALAFDKRGTGKSTGDWERASLIDLGRDVAAAVSYLRTRPDILPDEIGLTGSSQAGWIMPLATREVPDVLFIQHRSAASPLGVRDQERIRLIRQMQFDKYSQADIDRAVRVRDLMDDYAATGVGWKTLQAEAAKVSSEYWMTQFIGGLPARDAPDWAWLHDNFLVDTTPDFTIFRGSWDVMYGGKDPIAALTEGRAALEHALQLGHPKQVSIEVIPDATHDYMEARIGSDREFPGLSRFVPGFYNRVVDWAAREFRRAAPSRGKGR